MRNFPLFIIAALFAASPAGAQVTVDLHALEALPSTNPAPPRPASRPQPRPKVTLPPTAAAPQPTASQPAPQQPAPGQAPETPASAATAVLPVAPPPAAPAAMTAPPAVEAPRPPAASIRIPFAADQTELGKDGTAAIEGLIETAYAQGTDTFAIVGYAAGTQDDPSSARRLSLARALAVRAILMNNSVPSRKITVRALGTQAGDGPRDRVDIATAPSPAQ